MARNDSKDRIGQRLAALASAPQVKDAPPPAKKKRQREKDRQKVFRFAHVETPTGGELKCIVRDLTDQGARLTFEGEAALPAEITLVIEQAGLRRAARVVWQIEKEAGVKF